MKPKYFNITLYERTNHYGGPEEGGWYYDWYEPIETIRLKGKLEIPHNEYTFIPIKRDRQKFSKLIERTEDYGKYRYQGGITYFVESYYGKHVSKCCPHYE